MIDCGPASTYKMYRMGIKSTSVSHLFFTHLHSDHISDYPCFLMTRFDQSMGTEEDLRVYGPPPISDVTRRLWSPEDGLFWYDVTAGVNHPMSVDAFHSRGGEGERPQPRVHATEFGDGEVASGPGWRCTALEVQHVQPYINCYGLRFETDEGVVSFSGDTAPTQNVVELARDADLAVIEGGYLEQEIQTKPSRISQTGVASAGRMATQAGAKRLVINHQSLTLDPPDRATAAIHEVKEAFAGPVYWGRDLMEISWTA